MARYQVMFWKHIPSQVKAWDEGSEVNRMMPDRFHVAIDVYAMKDGSTDMDAYLDAKKRLFSELLAESPKSPRHAVVNLDDPYADAFRAAVPVGVRTLTYSRDPRAVRKLVG